MQRQVAEQIVAVANWRAALQRAARAARHERGLFFRTRSPAAGENAAAPNMLTTCEKRKHGAHEHRVHQQRGLDIQREVHLQWTLMVLVPWPSESLNDSFKYRSCVNVTHVLCNAMTSSRVDGPGRYRPVVLARGPRPKKPN